jgi:hypothetical protein
MKRLTYTFASLLISSAFGAQQPAVPEGIPEFPRPAFRNTAVPCLRRGPRLSKGHRKSTGGAGHTRVRRTFKDHRGPSGWLADFTTAKQSLPRPRPPLRWPQGARFNLEPRANAVPQNQASADFLLNRVGSNEDLIVQAANDWRGNLTSDKQWDRSVSGYYVHRAAAADCSVQFEGGLPAFSAQGSNLMGVGDPVVAADPARDAFFMADQRFGSADTGGVGLFRVAASRLLNASACPSGTHTEAQAASCWDGHRAGAALRSTQLSIRYPIYRASRWTSGPPPRAWARGMSTSRSSSSTSMPRPIR